MVLYVENLTDSTKKFLELISVRSVKMQDTKSTYKNFLNFYGSVNMQQKVKGSIPFITAAKTVRYLVTDLTKDVKDLSSEKYITLKTEIEDDTQKRKDIPCAWI